MGNRLERAETAHIEVGEEAGDVARVGDDQGDIHIFAGILGDVACGGCSTGAAADDDHPGFSFSTSIMGQGEMCCARSGQKSE